MYAVYPAFDGLQQKEVKEHAMVFCCWDETAKGIAAFEEAMTGMKHLSFVCDAPSGECFRHVEQGIFVKLDETSPRCLRRVQMFLDSIQAGASE